MQMNKTKSNKGNFFFDTQLQLVVFVQKKLQLEVKPIEEIIIIF